jgi:hypothetical protein
MRKKIIPVSDCKGLLQRAGRQIVAAFGTSRLVRNQNGRHELVGVTADDYAAAHEWCSLFTHEVVFTSAPRRNPAFAFAE